MNTSILQVKDDKQRRIIIPQELWDLEGLQKDDYVKLSIEKVKKPKDR